MDQSNDDEFDMPKEDPIEKWYNRQCSKINLNSVKMLIRNQFKSVCLLDNEQQLKTPSEPSSRLGAGIFAIQIETYSMISFTSLSIFRSLA